MTLIINNDHVSEVLTTADTMAALEEAYRQNTTGEAVCRPRVDIQIPTRKAGRTYQWGTMEGGSVPGYFAIRMKSDIIIQENRGGVPTEEKYCLRPGLYCGLILLTDVQTGEPLAFINDGVLQHMRVGADGGIGVKYIAKDDAAVVGMLGSGGMARSHMEAFMAARSIKRLQVFSPTKANREVFGREVAGRYSRLNQIPYKFPQQLQRRAFVAALLNQNVETLAFLIDSTPHVHPSAVDVDDHFIKMSSPGADSTIVPRDASRIGGKMRRKPRELPVGNLKVRTRHDKLPSRRLNHARSALEIPFMGLGAMAETG